MENMELYHNLVILIKIFDGKPYTLAKYLLDNDALSNDFTKNIMNSDMIKKIKDSDTLDIILNNETYLMDITDMKKMYNSFIDIKQLSNKKTIEEITKEYNDKLNDLVAQEKYEDALKVYNYMLKNNIKKI